MKERPIIFSAPMVRAILEGRKTQTRRIVKPHPEDGMKFGGWITDSTVSRNIGTAFFFHGESPVFAQKNHHAKCPYGEPGDRLWVRESFRLYDSSIECACYDYCSCASYDKKPIYRADSQCDDDNKWKPSIYIPRWASRINLIVKSVRVERLQEITEDDAIAEGEVAITGMDLSARDMYSALWDDLNEKRAPWDSNPWVWVIEFEVEQ